MASETPIVRHLLVCRELVVSESGASVTVRDLIHAVVRLPGEPFPLLQHMALYGVLTNGRGEHDIALQLAFLDRGEQGTQGEERILVTSPVRRVDLGQDPTRVFGLPFPLRVTFAEPGQYTFYLLCDGQRIAEEHLEVR